MPATMRTTRTRIVSAMEFKSLHDCGTYERPPLDLPDIVDDLGDRCVVVEARGKSASRQWFIVVDSPGGHFDHRMKIVAGIEREPEVIGGDVNEINVPEEPETDANLDQEQEIKFQTQFDQTTNEFEHTPNEFQTKRHAEPFEPDFEGKISPHEHSSSEEVDDANSASRNFPEVKEKFEPDWSESGTGFSQSTGQEPPKADLSQSTPGTSKDLDPFRERRPSKSEPRRRGSKVTEDDGELLEGFGKPQKRGVGFRKMVRKNRILRVFQKHPKVKTTNTNVIADEDVPFDGHGSRGDVMTRGYAR